MNKSFSRIILAGTHSGVGKTTITMGIMQALIKRGLVVQPYKVGPDYIDPGFHTALAGRACRNLDSYFFTKDVLLELFSRQAKKADLALIEGVMGLYDGLAENPALGSTAHVAKILKAPVILIIDASKIAASAGAVVLGYKTFDPDVDLAGCIVNRISGETHYQLVKKSIEEKSGVKVLGYLPKDNSFGLAERHLGLRPAQEVNVGRIGQRITGAAEKFIDLDALIAIGEKAPPLPLFKSVIFASRPGRKEISIAVARDKSFHFYYQDNLDILEHGGARLRFFSPLKSKSLPAGTSGVYIGGGFPEMCAAKLAANKTLLAELKAKSRAGLPIYAECAGLMYLMKELQTQDGRIFPMTGIFPGRTRLGKRLSLFGYYQASSEAETILGPRGSVCPGHLFHWSYTTRMPGADVFKLRKRGKVFYDGYARDKTVATYLHFHFAANVGLAANFIASCRRYQDGR